MVLERIISPDNYKGSYLKATLFGIIITAIGLTIGYNLFPDDAALAAIFFILIGIYLDKLTFNTSLFIWLGLTPAGFSTVDYFPIFPWFGIVLVGMFVGNVLYKNYSRSFKLKDLSSKKEVKLLSFLGRHSLIIYLIHQPIIITLLVILGYITL